MDYQIDAPCAQWVEKLAATHPDDLSPSERSALAMHLASCPACAAIRTEYQTIDALLLDFPDVEPLPVLPTWLLRSMSISVLAARYQESSHDCYGLELVRRAVEQYDREAWTVLRLQFSKHVRRWIVRHPRREAALRQKAEQNYVDDTFNRFWQAVGTQQLLFSTLAEALNFLHLCLLSSIQDTLRPFSQPEEMQTPNRIGAKVEDPEGPDIHV